MINLNRIIIILFILMLALPDFDAQIKNFGSKSKFKPEPTYKLRPYIYYDFVKTRGLGVQRLFGPYMSLDLSVFQTYNNKTYEHSQEDYTYYTGYGFSVNPRLSISLRGNLIIGYYFSLESIAHDKEAIKIKGPYYGDDYYYDVYSCKGTALTSDGYFAFRIPLGRFSLENFFMVGLMKFLKSESYYYDSDFKNNRTFPYTTSNTKKYLDLRFGIKLTFGLKRDKTYQTVDKKFDDEYIPRYNTLSNYTNSLRIEKSSNPRLISLTLRKIRGTNRQMLRIYRQNYYDIQRMFKKMDLQIKMLEGMVEQIKNLPPIKGK